MAVRQWLEEKRLFETRGQERRRDEKRRTEEENGGEGDAADGQCWRMAGSRRTRSSPKRRSINFLFAPPWWCGAVRSTTNGRAPARQSQRICKKSTRPMTPDIGQMPPSPLSPISGGGTTGVRLQQQYAKPTHGTALSRR